jgi:hypothetical protein
MTAKQPRVRHRCECDECRVHPHGHIANEHRAINRVLAGLNEKNRRRFAGVLALERDYGGVQEVHKITGLSRTTIHLGRREVRKGDRKKSGGIRSSGGGQPAVEKKRQTS